MLQTASQRKCVSIPGEEKNFSQLRSVLTDSDAHLPKEWTPRLFRRTKAAEA